MSDLDDAIEVLEAEAAAVKNVITHLDQSFVEATELCLQCTGRIAVSGMGKAGIIGEKISATMASTGTPSFFIHPAEAVHGDLGRLRPEDVVLVLSNSGETAEVLRLIDSVRLFGAKLIAITGNARSTLAKHADYHLFIGEPGEACPMGLAPTSTTTAMLALGDALAMVIQKRRDFGPEDYARFHPGGSLGRRLMRVDEIMRAGERFTVVSEDTSSHEVLLAMNQTPGRPGAACITDNDGLMTGFITDGDLVRAMGGGAEFLTLKISEVMNRTPKTIEPDKLVSEAERVMREFQIDQLAVIDTSGKPLGLIDVQDLVRAR